MTNPVIPHPHWRIPNDISKAIPLKEAAKKLNYHPNTLRNRAKVGKSPHCFKIGSYWFCIIDGCPSK
jgi:hypothetical protein